MTITSRATLVLLVDSRLPTGAHVHSGGIEAAVADGRVRDVASLRSFLEGRLATGGFVDAAFSAAAWDEAADLASLNAEVIARCPSGELRSASRRQARGLLRAADAVLGPERRPLEVAEPVWPVALGHVTRELALGPLDAAFAAAHASATGPAWAAVRLLGLDPFEVVAVLASLAGAIDRTSQRGANAASSGSPLRELPAHGSPLTEIASEAHARWEVRLFVS